MFTKRAFHTISQYHVIYIITILRLAIPVEKSRENLSPDVITPLKKYCYHTLPKENDIDLRPMNEISTPQKVITESDSREASIPPHTTVSDHLHVNDPTLHTTPVDRYIDLSIMDLPKSHILPPIKTNYHKK